MTQISDIEKYWNNRPCNFKHSSTNPGTKQYFDEVETKRYFVEPHIPQFANFEEWKGKNVLEIGCGIGTESINFVRAGAILTIIELSAVSLELCKQRFKIYGLCAKFIHGNAEELEKLVNKKFDLVWSFGVIHHTLQPQRIIDGIYKVLKDDGIMKIMLYSKVSYKMFWIMKEYNCWDMSNLDMTIAKYSEAQTGCPVTHTYTFDEIKELLNNFKIVKIWKAHIFTWDIPNYINHKYVKDKSWMGVNDYELAKLEKELGWHTMVIAKKL